MNSDRICCQKSNPQNLIYQSDFWKIELSQDQIYLGQCYVTLNRHCGDIAEITQEEWLEFIEIVKRLEKALKKSFKATKFDWAVLMNHAYLNNPPNPHIHWHFVPRYNHEVTIGEIIFKDPNFGHHYKSGENHLVTSAIRESIVNKIKLELSQK